MPQRFPPYRRGGGRLFHVGEQERRYDGDVWRLAEIKEKFEIRHDLDASFLSLKESRRDESACNNEPSTYRSLVLDHTFLVILVKLVPRQHFHSRSSILT